MRQAETHVSMSTMPGDYSHEHIELVYLLYEIVKQVCNNRVRLKLKMSHENQC